MTLTMKTTNTKRSQLFTETFLAFGYLVFNEPYYLQRSMFQHELSYRSNHLLDRGSAINRVVTQTGFEPMNNALRGHRVKPLLHWASDKLFNHNCFFISTGFYRFLHHSQDCYLLF